jgi:NAD(P)H-dependent FMN reductase
MDAEPLRLAVLSGAAGQGRLGAAVADWFADLAAARSDMEVDSLDLSAACLPEAPAETAAECDDSAPAPASVRDLAPWLAAADAFVVVTPERGQGAPGALQDLVDWFPARWSAKPVGFCAYGPGTGGLHAVRQLRLAFGQHHAVPVRDAVAVGGPADLTTGARCPAAAGAMLDQLAWWGAVLRAARAENPPRL